MEFFEEPIEVEQDMNRLAIGLESVLRQGEAVIRARGQ